MSLGCRGSSWCRVCEIFLGGSAADNFKHELWQWSRKGAATSRGRVGEEGRLHSRWNVPVLKRAISPPRGREFARQKVRSRVPVETRRQDFQAERRRVPFWAFRVPCSACSLPRRGPCALCAVFTLLNQFYAPVHRRRPSLLDSAGAAGVNCYKNCCQDELAWLLGIPRFNPFATAAPVRRSTVTERKLAP